MCKARNNLSWIDVTVFQHKRDCNIISETTHMYLTVGIQTHRQWPELCMFYRNLVSMEHCADVMCVPSHLPATKHGHHRLVVLEPDGA